MLDFIFNEEVLPIIFMAIMGIAVFCYVILDGYDLGVGVLIGFCRDEKERDMIISSISPFWDANETWLVLAVGVLLIAFPKANGIISTALYIPIFIMLIALIIRGVSLDFREKVKYEHKYLWDHAFNIGSLIASLAQGFMLGMFIMGFKYDLIGILFSILTGFCLVSGYMLLGSCWLIMRTESVFQLKAIAWAKQSLHGAILGMIIVSMMTPLVNIRIFEKWFTLPNFYWLCPIPLLTGYLIFYLNKLISRMPLPNDQLYWLPFLCCLALYLLGFYGLAYSFYPFIVPNQLTIWEAANSKEALSLILIGVVIVLPCIFGYTYFAYRVFWGKTTELKYY